MTQEKNEKKEVDQSNLDESNNKNGENEEKEENEKNDSNAVQKDKPKRLPRNREDIVLSIRDGLAKFVDVSEADKAVDLLWRWEEQSASVDSYWHDKNVSNTNDRKLRGDHDCSRGRNRGRGRGRCGRGDRKTKNDDYYGPAPSSTPASSSSPPPSPPPTSSDLIPPSLSLPSFLPKKGTDDDTKYYSIPAIADKKERGKVHAFLRSDEVKRYALADTADNGIIRIWHRCFQTQMPSYRKFGTSGGGRGEGKGRGGKGGGWPKDRPEYLRFVLYKENMDTSKATKDISRIAGSEHGGGRFGGRGGRFGGRGGRGGRFGGRGGRDAPRAAIGYAGMKDKRGVTAQFCTLHKKTPMDVLKVNRSWDDDRNDRGIRGRGGGGGKTGSGRALMRVGHFQYVPKEVRLGMLSGNRFNIALRNVTTKDVYDNSSSNDGSKCIEDIDRCRMHDMAVVKRLETAVDSLRANGFVNYFGTQRFGKFGDTHMVGVAVLAGNYELACDIIMRGGSDDNGQKNNVSVEKDGAGSSVLWKREENSLQKEVREIWTRRFEGLNVKEEGIIKKDDKDNIKKSNENGNDKDNKETTSIADRMNNAEWMCATKLSKMLGRFMLCETSIIEALRRQPRDYKRAFECIPARMRSMFLHSYQSYLWNKVTSCRIRECGGKKDDLIIGDLVLVKNKDENKISADTAVMGNTNEHGKSEESSTVCKIRSVRTEVKNHGSRVKTVHAVIQEDIDQRLYNISDLCLPLVGPKVVYPKNFTGNLFDKMLAEDGLSRDHFSKFKDREIALKGDYRRVICRPTDVDFAIVSYFGDPFQPLLQTDLMKVDGIKLSAVKTLRSGSGIMDADDMDVEKGRADLPNNVDDSLRDLNTISDNGVVKQTEDNKGKNALLGMVVKFTLPSSAYATIALRELMKRPTSSGYQAGLSIEGNCDNTDEVMGASIEKSCSNQTEDSREKKENCHPASLEVERVAKRARVMDSNDIIR